MSTRQVTTWRRYTAAEKKAYRARQRRRFIRALGGTCEWQLWMLEQIDRLPMVSRRWADIGGKPHFFADGFGSRVPTARLNGEVL